MSKHSSISRSGRFQKAATSKVIHYSESVSFDWKLYRQDIAGSIAHATMLTKAGILTKHECKQIIHELKKIEKEIDQGKFPWKKHLEDVHMNIEAALSARVPSAAKLHTARSRNDQVATDTRLWVKDKIKELESKIKNLQKALIDLAEQTRIPFQFSTCNLKFLPIPGYTHLQRAQPVLAAHHLLAYAEMFQRDLERFLDCAKRTDFSPLGSAAIAGSSLPINRKLTAKLLGFYAPSTNSMDAVSDRDFVAEFLFTSALTGIHLSRLAEDFIFWSSAEFEFITIGDAYTTGSSLMPQKKNPDIAELARGKSGRLIGNLVSILTLLKGLPMTYNRDLQEDKEPLFDSAETLLLTLSIFADMTGSIQFNPKACFRAASDPNLMATEAADYLVRRGMPFRQAHHVVGTAVQFAEKHQKPLTSLTLNEWQKIHPSFGKDVKQALELNKFFNSRDRLIGAPAPRQVEIQLRIWKKRLKQK